jgi:ABC-type sugar transport system substrate-binding protein
MKILKQVLIFLLVLSMLILDTGCSPSTKQDTKNQLTIGIAFETLQTEYWVASYKLFQSECSDNKIKMLEAVANGDANRQFEQIRNFISRKVNGIIVVPKDGNTVIPMIKAANKAGIPIVCYNRPPSKSDAKSVSVIADNYKLTYETVNFLISKALQKKSKIKAMILVGDLGDINAIERRNGFEDAVSKFKDNIEIVARIPTEWNNEKAKAGIANALQAHPDVDLIFTSSDLHLPAIASSLKEIGRYKKSSEDGHVILGSFDGDATAYKMILDGYLDAVGVQDVFFEVKSAVKAIMDLNENKECDEIIRDPGLVVTQENIETMKSKMWGAILVNK